MSRNDASVKKFALAPSANNF